MLDTFRITEPADLANCGGTALGQLAAALQPDHQQQFLKLFTDNAPSSVTTSATTTQSTLTQPSTSYTPLTLTPTALEGSFLI